MKKVILWFVALALRSLTEDERIAVLAEIYPGKHLKHLRRNPRKK